MKCYFQTPKNPAKVWEWDEDTQQARWLYIDTGRLSSVSMHTLSTVRGQLGGWEVSPPSWGENPLLRVQEGL